MSPCGEKNAFHLSLGVRGEMIAWNFLVENKYKILEKNYRCKIGEIDVVAEKKGRLSFIEVKTRTGLRFGRPEEAVHFSKKRKLIQLARWYLKEKKKENVGVSFDVVSVLWHPQDPPRIRLIENVLSVDEVES